MRFLFCLIVFLNTSLSFATEYTCYCNEYRFNKDYADSVDIFLQSARKLFFPSDPVTFPYDWEEVTYNGLDPAYDQEGEILWEMPARSDERTPWFRRTVKWTDAIDSESTKDFEHKECNYFRCTGSYSLIPQAFALLRKDCELYYQRSIQFWLRRIADLKRGATFFVYPEEGVFFLGDKGLPGCRKTLEEVRAEYKEKLKLLNQHEQKAMGKCKNSLQNCLQLHGQPLAHYDMGLFCFLEGDHFEAFSHLEKFVKKGDKEDLEKLAAETYLLKGQLESELNLYADAVISLTEAIKIDPKRTDLYFERAKAYFENGQINEALSDYLQHKDTLNFSPIKKESLKAFMNAFSQAAAQGFSHALVEFGPTLLSAAQGIGHCLWAGVTDPTLFSEKTATAVFHLFDYLSTHEISKVGKDACSFLSPELTQLFSDWGTLKAAERGNLAGLAIGKGGFNLLAGHALVKSAKALSALREAQHANALFTLEVLSQKSAASIALEQKSKELVARRLESIQKFKQDEAFFRTLRNQQLTEVQIRQTLHSVGYQTFKKPVGIPENYNVKFADKGAGMKYVNPLDSKQEIRIMPGKPHSPNPAQQQPYVKHQISEDVCLDVKGNKVPWNSPEAHIPVDEYIYRPE